MGLAFLPRTASGVTIIWDDLGMYSLSWTKFLPVSASLIFNSAVATVGLVWEWLLITMRLSSPTERTVPGNSTEVSSLAGCTRYQMVFTGFVAIAEGLWMILVGYLKKSVVKKRNFFIVTCAPRTRTGESLRCGLETMCVELYLILCNIKEEMIRANNNDKEKNEGWGDELMFLSHKCWRVVQVSM